MLPPEIDYANPTASMIEDGKKHGIDLTDPVVQQELARLDREKREKVRQNKKITGKGGEEMDEEELKRQQNRRWWMSFTGFMVVGLAYRLWSSGLWKTLFADGDGWSEGEL